ncbi:MAG: citrate synthase [Ruminococcus sp.]|nr:citrate synthase [Ruminococcus sp.]
MVYSISLGDFSYIVNRTAYDRAELEKLIGKVCALNKIDPSLYEKYSVKRGLRNADGTGVVAGITNICNVHGYVIDEGEKKAIPGELFYRGININEIISETTAKSRFGFEETAYLLLFGELPTKAEFAEFDELLTDFRVLPSGFSEDMIFKAPSRNIMNKMVRSVSALYSYDDDPEDMSVEKELLRAISIIARLPSIMVDSYQIKKRIFDNDSLFMHPSIPEESVAESILSTLRADRNYTKEEALLLDLCLILHAEHGGGNNSTFVCRTLTSSGTDAYSAYGGAIGSLKGPRHGGANAKVMAQTDEFREKTGGDYSDSAVSDMIVKVLKKEAGDGSGLIYGMGHAVYTVSDPRAKALKENALKIAEGTEYEREFCLLDAIERLTPGLFAEIRGADKAICANVDMYSGLVYKMLGVPPELYTPLFAVSRITGWAAHRIEELLTGKRIIRPAYKAIAKLRSYTPVDER